MNAPPLQHRSALVAGALVITLAGSFGCREKGPPSDVAADRPMRAPSAGLPTAADAGATTAVGSNDEAGSGAELAAAPTSATPHAECPPGMAFIAGATFHMGPNGLCLYASDPDCVPAHDVTLPSFCIDKNEVTEADYARCADCVTGTPPYVAAPATCRSFGPRVPATCLSGFQAARYCETRDPSRRGRLPTEEQWELAARGPSGRQYPYVGSPPAEHDVCTGRKAPCEVGTSRGDVTPEGVTDMLGNAAEWTRTETCIKDHFHRSADGGCVSAWIRRGGNWGDSGPTPLAVLRYPTLPAQNGSGIGFRCVTSP